MIIEQLKEQQSQLAMQVLALTRQLKTTEEQYDATTNALHGATAVEAEVEPEVEPEVF